MVLVRCSSEAGGRRGSRWNKRETPRLHLMLHTCARPKLDGLLCSADRGVQVAHDQVLHADLHACGHACIPSTSCIFSNSATRKRDSVCDEEFGQISSKLAALLLLGSC
jgi:hypothetical protein